MPRYYYMLPRVDRPDEAQVIPTGFYVASSPARLRRWLRRHVAGGLRGLGVIWWTVDHRGNQIGDSGAEDLAARPG